jgi:PAS domain S-box-containing protein
MTSLGDPDRARPTARVPRYGIVALVVAAGIWATAFLFVRSRDGEQRRIEADFENAAQNHAAALQRSIELELLLIEALRSWYVAADGVSLDEFRAFVTPILQRGKGVRALEWVPRVTDAGRAEYEAAMKRTGAPGYRITERVRPGQVVPAARREEYFPVSDVDPGREGDLALGFDLASEPTRREAILRARDTGALAATAPVTLLRETQGEHGFLVFIPVYERGKPAESLEDRRRYHRGLIAGVFRLPDLVEGALSYLQPMGIDVSISDDSAPPGERQLFARRTSHSGTGPVLAALPSGPPEGELEHQAILDVAGRRWSVRCFTAPGFVAGRRTSYPTAVLVAGLLVTGLLAAYLVASIRRTEELRRSQAFLDSIYTGLPHPVWVVDVSPEGAISTVGANPAWERLSGHSSTEIVGMGIDAMRTGFGEEGFSRSLAALTRCIETGEPIDEEADRIITGRQGWFLRHLSPVRDAQGRVWRIIGTTVDISRQKEAEETLRRGQRLLAEAERIARLGAWEVDLRTGVVRCSPEAWSVVGAPASRSTLEELTWQEIETVSHPEDLDRLRERARRLLDGHALEEFEHRFSWGDGPVRTVVAKAELERDPDGQPARAFGSVQDVTDRKRAEQALRDSEERYRLLFDGNPLPMLVYDADSLRFLAVNDAAPDLYGYTREELLSFKVGDLAVPGDPTYAEFLATRLEPRPDLVHVGLRRQRRKEGSVIDIDLTSLSVPFAGRRARLMLARDVTAERQAVAERARLQAAVEQAAAEWQRTFDAVEPALLVFDSEARVVRLNRVATVLVGSAAAYQEILGLHVTSLGGGEPWPTAARLLASAVLSRTTASAEARDPGLGKAWALTVSIAPVGAGAAERLILVVADVTRLVELQESLRRTETMAAMGTLVAGVAHEVRNPLFAITAMLDTLETEYGQESTYAECAEALRAQVDRLNHLTRDLLEYGKPPALRLRQARPEKIVRIAVRACSLLARERGVHLVEDVDPGLPSLAVDADRMHQVIENLLANAIQHSPRDSTVRVAARVSSTRQNGAMLFLVEDEGPGIAEAHRTRLFEPFFSRREGGTGLGLSIVQRIVEAHGGKVSIETRSRGAAFVVTLPLAEAAESAAPPPPA